MEYLLIFFKAIGMFIVGLIAFRLMGSQAVGRLTDFDLVVVIAIGALIGAPLADHDLNLLVAISAIAGLVCMQLLVSYLALKYSRFEKVVAGSPIKLIERGKVVMRGLMKARLSLNDLEQELRSKGFATKDHIHEAFLEPNGRVSVIHSEQDKPDRV